jgi:hypothetical protein
MHPHALGVYIAHRKVDDVLSHEPLRQWVLSFPLPLRFLLSSYPELLGKMLGIVLRVFSTRSIGKAGFTGATLD